MVNAEFFDALEQLEKEKGIPVDYMLDRVGQALITAYKRDNDGMTDNVYVEPNREEKTIRMYVRKTVVRTEDLYEPYEEITLEEAADYKVNPQVGDIIDIDIPTKSFGRIAAQTAKQVIIQGIREAERTNIMKEYEKKREEVVPAVVTKLLEDTGDIVVDTGTSETVMRHEEMIPGEHFEVGDRIKVFITEVRREGQVGPIVTLSRTHPGMIKRLMELEIPEIQDGVVIIKGVAREAGSRTKVSVFSRDEAVDPVGACIGERGQRIAQIVDELGGEKIDVVKFSEIPEEYIAAALSPAEVKNVEFDGERSAKVLVDSDQLSLAIGKEGQNARLAARLTGYKIDIKGSLGIK